MRARSTGADRFGTDRRKRPIARGLLCRAVVGLVPRPTLPSGRRRCMNVIAEARTHHTINAVKTKYQFLGHMPGGHRNARPRAFSARRQPHFMQRVSRRYLHASQISSRSRYCVSLTVLQPSATKSASERARFHACRASDGGCCGGSDGFGFGHTGQEPSARPGERSRVLRTYRNHANSTASPQPAWRYGVARNAKPNSPLTSCTIGTYVRFSRQSSVQKTAYREGAAGCSRRRRSTAACTAWL